MAFVVRVTGNVWCHYGHRPTTSSRQCLSISRMLDLGGMPSSASDKKAVRRVNASKNSKIRAISFDFDLLTRCLQQDRLSNNMKEDTSSSVNSIIQPKVSQAVMPDVNVVQQFASLLGVRMGSETTPLKPPTVTIMSTMSGEAKIPRSAAEKPDVSASTSPDFGDVRSKYASKLRHKLDGGVASLELARSEREENLKRGDAPAHLAALALAKQNVSSAGTAGTRWMALTGTGALLNYLSNRSIKIALLPKPNHPHREQEGKQMKDFSSQLQDVHVDVMLDAGTDSAVAAVQDALQQLGDDPVATLLVSDRDDYIRAANDAGMITCRIRPMNAPRGNASAHFSKEEVAGVQEVIDEMNGISFNALQNR